jgi:hypothetical protein
MRKAKESDIYFAIAKFMKLKHPRVLWRFDFSAGVKMSIGQAKSHKGLNPHRGYPDFFICQPSNGYAGLYIEIKKEGERTQRKDGTLYADQHLEEQHAMLNHLNMVGYKAVFGIGLMECIEIIEEYLR